ncbi:MAG: hypothetical protein GTN76_05250 [Candidatus Aenigmarchaeota archaeon]|nr:hypothetical protein [Candidatus Aenigmarchaeota archaeon]
MGRRKGCDRELRCRKCGQMFKGNIHSQSGRTVNLGTDKHPRKVVVNRMLCINCSYHYD